MEKKTYERPTMKLFSISADERIAVTCYGGSHFTFGAPGCTELLTDGKADGSCQYGPNQGS